MSRRGARSGGARKGAGRAGRARRLSPVARLAWLVILIAAAVFAVQGGEYGTTDLLRQRAARKQLVAEIDSLQRVVDSLQQYERAVETDPALQERIAREEFGMVRDREILYRFAGGRDTVRDGGR